MAYYPVSFQTLRFQSSKTVNTLPPLLFCISCLPSIVSSAILFVLMDFNPLNYCYRLNVSYPNSYVEALYCNVFGGGGFGRSLGLVEVMRVGPP